MTDSGFEGIGPEMEASSTDVREDGRRQIEKFTKRFFDLVFAAVAITSLIVPMVFIILAMKYFAKGPVFFCHERIGLDGEPFKCIKFRTMVVDAREQLEALLERDPIAAQEFATTRKLENDPRIIPVIGHILRKTSFDELPQFLNVLVGDMSIVGPRPVPRDEFEENYGYAHPYIKVRPGITGLWQISGRNDVSYEERVQMDRNYVRAWSFWGDIRIVFKTMVMICIDPNGK